jgi:hypothetical protein
MKSTLGETIARYAAGLQPTFGEAHHVASALGAWLVLALAAPAATGEDRVALEAALGEPAEQASTIARSLLAEPHPAVAAAAAVWSRATAHGVGWDAWAESLGQAAGPMPSQAEADAWVRKHTSGLIEGLPIDLSPDVLFTLVSALATKVSWNVPFAVASAEELGGAWGVARVLRSQPRHRCLIVADPEAGDVAVHIVESGEETDGLAVVSVLAAPGITPSTTLAAAHRIALGDAPARSLSDLPLGEGHGWQITEEPGQGDRVWALLPAWSAASTHDLLADPATGFAAGNRGVGALLAGPETAGPGQDSVAVQQAVAQYSRVGFQAAAVTLFGRKTAASIGGTRRVAVLEFSRPYAAIAVTRQAYPDGYTGPWHGLPVFSAWITRADEVADEA